MKKLRATLLLFLISALVVGVMPEFKAKAVGNEMLDTSAQVSSDIEGKEELEINGEKYT
ncbi:hypothetical protein [Bacillus halotolerans]|uniref:hypothetical protein n=1 Tax=Bacillus halotolerans TaxID=260554 RepID=UPI003F6CA657